MKKLLLYLVFFLTANCIYSQWELVPGWIHTAPSISNIVSYNDTVMAEFGGSLLISLDNGNSWDTVSIDDAYIQVPKIINNKLVVGTNNGFYISSDMGNNWIPKNNVINFSINEICYDNDKLYISEYGNGIFYSSDWGDNWFPIAIQGLPYTNIRLFDVRNNEIWVTSMKQEKIGNFTFYYGGLFTSNNYGENWEPVMNGQDTLQASYFARNGDSIFVIEYNSLLMFMSPDNGENWNKVNVAGGNTMLYSMFLKDSVIFVWTLSGIYVSTNSGGTWTFKGNALPNIVYFTYNGQYFFTIGQDSHTIYSSTNLGSTWKKIYENILYAKPTALSARDGIIYAGTPTKLAVSSDQGKTWIWNEKGLVESKINAVEAIGNNIFVGNELGLFMSSDKGEHWNQCARDTTLKLPKKVVYAISIDGNNVVASISDGILLSTDLGETWQFRSFAKHFYVVPVALGGNTIFAGSWGAGLYKSTDMGETWQQYKFTDQKINAISLLDNYVYVGISNDLVISEDFGETWVNTKIGFLYGNLMEFWVNAISNDGENLFLKAYKNGVFLSTDLGTTWEPRNNGLQLGGSSDRTPLVINNDYIFLNMNSFSGSLKSFYRARLADLITGVDVKEDQIQSQNSLFPNPARDYIIATQYLGWQYQIYDLLGNCIQTGYIESDRINISLLPAGFYTVRFFKDGKQAVEKLMKE